MHYHMEVWAAERPDDAEAFVDEVLAGMSEEDNDQGFYDWFQVGGRWTGAHDPNYNPETDERNLEPCDLCHGTGYRDDLQGQVERVEHPDYTCNGCGRHNDETLLWELGPKPGWRVKWPTSWAEFAGDTMSLVNVPEDLECHTLVIWNDRQAEVFFEEVFDGQHFVKTEFDGKVKPWLSARGIVDGYLITVDYHA